MGWFWQRVPHPETSKCFQGQYEISLWEKRTAKTTRSAQFHALPILTCTSFGPGSSSSPNARTVCREATAQPMISIPASSASKVSTKGSAFHIHAHYLTVKCEAASHLRPPLIYKGKLLALNGLFQCFFDIGDVHLASGKNVTKTGIGTIQINQGLACWYLAGNRMPKTSLTCLKRTNLHRI